MPKKFRAHAALSTFVALAASTPLLAQSFETSSARAWGSNASGQAVVPASVVRPKVVAAGGDFSLAVLEAGGGTVVGWGGNGSGQLNIPAGLANVAWISCGFAHAVAMLNDGQVRCWGSNSSGQCNVPAGLIGCRLVAAGSSNSFAIRANGSVVGWGSNSSGQLTIPSISNAVRISAGSSHVGVARSDGSLLLWGATLSGQTTVPAGVSRVTHLACGGAHTIVRMGDSTVRAWGSNVNGQCNVPLDLGVATEVGAGSQSSAAILADGTVRVWGNSQSGASIQPPAGLAQARLVSLGPSHVVTLNDTRVDPFEWKVENGGNGHWYDVQIAPNTTWSAEKTRAESLGGHLATIGSEAEGSFVHEMVLFQPASWQSLNLDFGPWIGLEQPAGSAEPAGGWRWVTGEPLTYAFWAPNEPNNAMCRPSGVALPEGVAQVTVTTGRWNDSNDVPDSCFGWLSTGSIIEWDEDCNGDGVVDFGQIRSGALPDVNGNGRLDACECLADVSGDGQVNGIDLAIVLTSWGERAGAGDANADGTVDGVDLAVVLGAWGPCGK